jgi:cytochrome c oxidase subunit II
MSSRSCIIWRLESAALGALLTNGQNDVVQTTEQQTGWDMELETIRRAIVSCIVIAGCSAVSYRATAADAPRRIEIVAKRFTYTPSEITLKKGQPVILVLHSADVAHGIKFAELNLKTDIGKDATSELPFTPTQIGDFVGHCSHFCGAGHGSMTLTLHVTE